MHDSLYLNLFYAIKGVIIVEMLVKMNFKESRKDDFFFYVSGRYIAKKQLC